MKLSTDRILTTHVGSLPRPDDLFEMMLDKMDGKPVDEKSYADRVRKAVADSVRDNYYPAPNERQVLRDEDRTVDGRAAHLYEFQLSWNVPGYDATGERAALLLIDVGGPAPALLYISIPNTHAELYGVIDRLLESVDVL